MDDAMDDRDDDPEHAHVSGNRAKKNRKIVSTRLDQDGDANISKAEIARAKKSKEMLDLDGDGIVSKWEKETVQHHHREELQALEERKRFQMLSGKARLQLTPAIKLTILLMVSAPAFPHHKPVRLRPRAAADFVH